MQGRDARDAVALIVVDGGASRCRLAAVDATGRRVAETSIDAPASLTIGVSEAWRTIRSGIEQLTPVWPQALALGLAGALQDVRREAFLERVRRETEGAVRCRLVTDGHAQLVGATLGKPGICLAVGTGSVLHWLTRDGHSGMAGGWGFPVGDEGSGAWLGVRLLRRYLWHRDGETSDSVLMAMLDERLGESVSSVQGVTTDTRSTTHARLATWIVEAAERGDALASSLLDDGADRCVRLIERAPHDLPVHVAGGLAKAYASRLDERLGTRAARRVLPAHGDAFDGLILIAAGH